jgi:hypothetical protein
LPPPPPTPTTFIRAFCDAVSSNSKMGISYGAPGDGAKRGVDKLLRQYMGVSLIRP